MTGCVTDVSLRLTTVKAHKSTLLSKERDLVARETALVEREAKVAAVFAQKDEELTSLRNLLATAETTMQQRVREAVARRDEELRAMVVKQEAEVASRMAFREQEIMEAVRKREEQMAQMWAEWERQLRETMGRAVEERMEWVQQQANELEQERTRLENVKRELEAKMKAIEAPAAGERRTRSKNPLEEVKNIMAPLTRLTDSPEPVKVAISHPAKLPEFKTPMPTRSINLDIAPPSAMKGVILTSTGEPIATPTPAELAKLFVDTPKVGLNFAKIFDFDTESENGDSDGELSEDGYETDSRPRATKREKSRESLDSDHTITPTQSAKSTGSTTSSASTSSTGTVPPVRPTRLRRPSIRASSASAAIRSALATDTASSSSGPSRPRGTRAASTSAAQSSSSLASTSATSAAAAVAALAQAPPPQYDFNDVENLPSPFLKKTEDRAAPPAKPAGRAPRKSGATLRAMAVVNAAKASSRPPSTSASTGTTNSSSCAVVRSSIVKAQKASEEARKALGVKS